MSPRTLSFAFGLVLAVGVPAPRADACMNEILRSQREVIQDLQRAERHLRAGRPDQALRILGAAELEASEYALDGRLLRLASIATVRLEGRVRGFSVARSTDEDTRLANLEQARAELDRARAEADTPEARQWSAEAQLALGQDVEAALTMLRELAAADLITDGYGYLALARASTGDEAAAHLAACARIAGSARRRICRAPRPATPRA